MADLSGASILALSIYLLNFCASRVLCHQAAVEHVHVSVHQSPSDELSLDLRHPFEDVLEYDAKLQSLGGKCQHETP